MVVDGTRKSIYKKKDSTFTLFDLCEEKLPDLLLIIDHLGNINLCCIVI